MTRMRSFDRAALVLGVASVASTVFVLEDLNEYRFMTIGGASTAVAVVLGALAIVAGLAAVRVLSVVAGLAFAAAAAVELTAVATGNDWLGVNLSTMAFWIGLAVGLIVAGTAPRTDTPTLQTEGE